MNKSDVKEGRYAKEYKAGVGAVCKLPLLALSEREKGKKMLMAVGGQHHVFLPYLLPLPLPLSLATSPPPYP